MNADAPEFPAIAQTAEIFARLDAHRKRQVFAFLAERYGWNLAPAPKRIASEVGKGSGEHGNRSELAAMEEAIEILDPLKPDLQRQAVAFFATKYEWKIQASFKPPARGFAPKRKYTKA